MLLLLTGWWHLMVLDSPLIHVGTRLRMYLLLHSHCLLLHARLRLLGLLQGCGLGPAELTRRTAHVTVTHWSVRSTGLPCLKTTHPELLGPLLLRLLLLLLLSSCLRPGIAKQNLPLCRARLCLLRR